MPELPEVEVVKKSLENKLKNLTVKKVNISNNKLRYKIINKQFNKIKNQKIISIQRRSKYLLINLNKGFTILVHLGMTGKFLIRKDNLKDYKTSFYYNLNSTVPKHNHIIFKLNNKTDLIYNDVRKFGFLKIIKTIDFNKNPHIKILGPEPLSKKFNKFYFKQMILNKIRKIKDVLMDQKIVSGLGNIYVNEILFWSKIKPNRKVNSINHTEIKKIIYYSKSILIKSIKDGGSSIKDFANSNGKSGKFQQKFTVYGREGKKCPNYKCQTLIKKINISNRASFYCKNCQK